MPSPRLAPATTAGKSSAVRIAFTPGMRQRRARVDPRDPRMRHRAEEQLREEHAVGAEVLGVLRLSGDLRDEIRRGVVLSDQLWIQPRPSSSTWQAATSLGVATGAATVGHRDMICGVNSSGSCGFLGNALFVPMAAQHAFESVIAFVARVLVDRSRRFAIGSTAVHGRVYIVGFSTVNR